MYIAYPTHGAGTRLNRTQPPTAARKTTVNAGQFVRQPRKGRGSNRQAPSQKKTGGGGGGGAKTAHSHQTARQHHKRRPNPPPRRHRRQVPQRGAGGPPSQNRQHQARNSGPPGKGTPKQADAHHEKKKKSVQPMPKERGWGDRGHKARDRNTQQLTPQSKRKKRKKHTPTTQPRRAGHSRDPGPARTPTPHTGTGNDGGQAEPARNHTRPITRPKAKPNHEHHKQPAKEGQHHKPCRNTPTQDPSQDWRG